MTTTTIALLIALLLLPIIILRGYGWSQRRIAEHMGLSRYRVRLITVASGC